MKKYLSIYGWCPTRLEKGQLVLFRLHNALHVGYVGKGYNTEEDIKQWFEADDVDRKHESWYITSLDGKTKYYPYASDVCPLTDNDYAEIHDIHPTIVED